MSGGLSRTRNHRARPTQKDATNAAAPRRTASRQPQGRAAAGRTQWAAPSDWASDTTRPGIRARAVPRRGASSSSTTRPRSGSSAGSTCDSAGFDTLEASDGASALALARAERPDLILLDVMLPELDGWRVAEELGGERRDARDPDRVPVRPLRERGPDARPRDRRRGLHHEAVRPAGDDEHRAGCSERVRRGEREAMRREWQRTLDGS